MKQNSNAQTLSWLMIIKLLSKHI